MDAFLPLCSFNDPAGEVPSPKERLLAAGLLAAYVVVLGGASLLYCYEVG